MNNQKYIKFSEEEKKQADSVNLVDYLKIKGESVKKVGSQYKVESLNGVFVNNHEWYDHYAKIGGGSISFLQHIYGFEYKDAVLELLGGNYILSSNLEYKKPEEKLEFKPPEKGLSHNKIIDYLVNQRFIKKDIVLFFIGKAKLYQDLKYNNIVFCGYDEFGKMRFAAKRGILDGKQSFKGNVEGSDGSYSFNHKGTNDILFVVESGIDLMSLASMMKGDWKENNYISLDGLSEACLLRFLEENPNIKNIVLAIDNDEIGNEEFQKLKDILNLDGYHKVDRLAPKYKDWNECLKAINGKEVKSAVPSFKIGRDKEICRIIYEMPKAELTKDYEKDTLLFINEARKNPNNLNTIKNCLQLTNELITHAETTLDMNKKDILILFANTFRAYKNRNNLPSKISQLEEIINSPNNPKDEFERIYLICDKLMNIGIDITKQYPLSKLKEEIQNQKPSEEINKQMM